MAAVAEQTGLTTLPAYLDLAEPDLGGAVRQLVDAGYAGAVVVPLLFTEAFHATVDVPETVRSVTESLAVQLTVADILGTGDERVAQLLRESMASSGIDDRASVLLLRSDRRGPAANEAAVDLAAAAGRGAVRSGTRMFRHYSLRHRGRWTVARADCRRTAIPDRWLAVGVCPRIRLPALADGRAAGGACSRLDVLRYNTARLSAAAL
jgi:sirohydrochlorin ferrochelatase